MIKILLIGMSDDFFDSPWYTGDASLRNKIEEEFKCKLHFIYSPKVAYDACYIFNHPPHDLLLNCVKGNVISIMCEPGTNRFNELYMFKNLDQYDLVYSPISISKNTILNHGYLGWYLNINYCNLLKLQIPNKLKIISCIMSNKVLFKGHRKRIKFKNFLKSTSLRIDYFGKGENFIEYKEDGLLQYKYSIAIENSSQPYYFTEKINECFLTYTVPIYYGCKNIDDYFPKDSYIWIDIDNPIKALETIRKTISNPEDYIKRLPHLKKARELVLEKYNLKGLISKDFNRILSNYENNERIITKLKNPKFNIIEKILKKFRMIYFELIN